MIAVVIPCFRVKDKILSVLSSIGSEVSKVYVVDDACPEQSGKHVQQNCRDPRVEVLFHEHNQGVGGAMITGYRKALFDKAQIVVKIDGDGQMDPKLIPDFCAPILRGEADYTKGNRFFDLESLKSMPSLRLFGNAALSFIAKLSCGYWNIMDPTNGYTAIHSKALSKVPLNKVSKNYFFESAMLFRLYTIRAVVCDIPMESVYGSEKSNLSIAKVLFSFPFLYLKKFIKRIAYAYFLRDFNAASIQILLAPPAIFFGFTVGWVYWKHSIETNIPATSGTVMLATLPIILGVQMLLFILQFDTQNVPTVPIQKLFNSNRK